MFGAPKVESYGGFTEVLPVDVHSLVIELHCGEGASTPVIPEVAPEANVADIC